MDALFERTDWLYAGLVLLVALIPRARFRVLGAAGLGPVLLAAASERVAGPSGGTTFATVNEGLVVLGAVVVIVAGVIGFRRAPQPLSGPMVPQSRDVKPHPLLFIGLALVALAPHLLLVELGILLGLLEAVRVTLRGRRLPWLTVLAVGGAMLASALILATTILGPGGGEMAGLRDGPFSPAAERLLVLLLGVGTFLLAGLPPLHRAPWGIGLAPLAAMVITRIALPALPGGVQEWQALAMLGLGVAGVSAALTRRWHALGVAAGLAALWSDVPSGILAAGLIVLWSWILELAVRAPGIPSLPQRWTGVLLLVPALAALPVLEAGLGAQVVVSVAFVAGVVIALVREFLRWPEGTPAPLY